MPIVDYARERQMAADGLRRGKTKDQIRAEISAFRQSVTNPTTQNIQSSPQRNFNAEATARNSRPFADIGRTGLETTKGLIKGAGQIGVGLADILGGAGTSPQLQSIKNHLKSSNPDQQVGQGVAQVLGTILPQGKIGLAQEGVTGLINASKLGKLRPALGLLSRAGIEGAGQATIAGATGQKNAEQTGLISAAVPLGGAALQGLKHLAGTVITEGLGMTSGAGQKAIQTAYNAQSKTFLSAMRQGGTETEDTIYKVAKTALNNIKDVRSSEYTEALDKITQSGMKLTPQLGQIKTKVLTALESYGIRNSSKGLDFAKSPINPSERKAVQSVIDEIVKWTDDSPSGLDLLKRRVDDLIPQSGKEASSLLKKARGFVRDALATVPGYDEMQSRYSGSSNLLEELTKSFSLKAKAGAKEAAIKKFMQALRTDNDIKQELLKEISRVTGVNIEELVAGQLLNPLVPRGLVGKVFGTGSLAGAGTAAIGGVGSLPTALAGVTASSPRIVGEGANLLGRLNRGVGTAIENTGLAGLAKRLRGQ